MWISQKTYTALIERAARAETSVQWLTVRVNQLEFEVGATKEAATGRPQLVPRVTTPRPIAIDDADVNFEDVGDDEARRLGVNWTDDGRVRLG